MNIDASNVEDINILQNERTFVNVLHSIFWESGSASFAIGHTLLSGMNGILEKGPIV